MSKIFNDFKALCQLEPVTVDYEIVSFWNESANNQAQRFIVCMQDSSGISDEDTRRVSMRVVVVSRAKDTQVEDLWDDAEALKEYLLKNPTYNCIIGTNSLAEVTSPRKMTDERFYCEFSMSILYTIH